MMEKRGRRAQIWVETVIYTLIGLTIIGILLAVVTPRIQQTTDRIVLEQTITALNDFNEKVIATLTAAGNSRQINFGIKEGELNINAGEDKVEYILRASSLKYSEPGVDIQQGDITIRTEEKDKKFNIFLTLDYSNLDITSGPEGVNTTQTLSKAPSPYGILIENKGDTDGDGKVEVNIRLV